MSEPVTGRRMGGKDVILSLIHIFLYTSGTVFHAFLGEKLPDWKAAENLVRKIAENYKLPYYTISPTYSICKDHGYLTGEVYICPESVSYTHLFRRLPQGGGDFTGCTNPFTGHCCL